MPNTIVDHLKMSMVIICEYTFVRSNQVNHGLTKVTAGASRGYGVSCNALVESAQIPVHIPISAA